MEHEPRLLYVTVADGAEAERIAAALIDERLAACVNLIAGMRACYRWQGAVQLDDQVVLIAKTTTTRSPAATARIVELHSDDLPCVIELPITGGHDPFLAWIRGETQGN